MKHGIVVILLSSFMLCGCSIFLDEKPSTSISKDTAYRSEASLEANLVAAYSGLSFFCSNAFYYYLGSASLLQEYTGRRTTDAFLQTHYLTMYSNTSTNDAMYSSLYSAVTKCNNLIAGLRNSPVSNDFKLEIEAEARMLRGLYYYTLTRLYGDLPIVTEPVSDEASCNIKRSQYSQVYEQIIDDLEFAAKYMKPYQPMGGSAKQGRACRMAANALLSSVYLNMGALMRNADSQFYDNTRVERLPDFNFCGVACADDAFRKSLKYSERVIESGVYRLENNYSHLFRWDPVNHPEDYLSQERILVFSATASSVASSIVPWMLWDNPMGTECNNVHNGNAGRIRASRWVFQKWAEKYGGSIDEESGLNVYVDCPDPRFDASYFHTEVWGVPSGTSSQTGEMVLQSLYPKRVKVSAASDPYIRKYFSKRYKADNGDADFYVMRFAEVYLNAAEAAACLSKAPSDEYARAAVGYVNVLLERARNSVSDASASSEWPNNWKASSFEDSQSLLDAVIWERVFELGNEGHEWFDTHKMGAKWLSENICQPLNTFCHLSENKTFWSYAFNDEDVPEDVAMVRKGLLVAFPDYEIRYNTALSQNDQNDFFIK